MQAVAHRVPIGGSGGRLDPDLRAARLQSIAIKLQEEGYVGPPDATGRVAFLSFLLRDYWGRNHV